MTGVPPEVVIPENRRVVMGLMECLGAHKCPGIVASEGATASPPARGRCG